MGCIVAGKTKLIQMNCVMQMLHKIPDKESIHQ